MKPNLKLIEWVLRVAVAGEFLGHGVLAMQQKASFIELITPFGISHDTAASLLPVIGTVDFSLAILILVWPMRLALIWMVFWGFATALARPFAGEPIWDFIERWPNWGAPLALLLLYGWPKDWRALFGHGRQ